MAEKVTEPLLYFENNQFTGELDVINLPSAIEELHLENNHFSGSLVVKGVPRGLKRIDAWGNHLHALAVVYSEALSRFMLRKSGVTSLLDENGVELDMKWLLSYSVANADVNTDCRICSYG